MAVNIGVAEIIGGVIVLAGNLTMWIHWALSKNAKRRRISGK